MLFDKKGSSMIVFMRNSKSNSRLKWIKCKKLLRKLRMLIKKDKKHKLESMSLKPWLRENKKSSRKNINDLKSKLKRTSKFEILSKLKNKVKVMPKFERSLTRNLKSHSVQQQFLILIT